jgi:hypothetical protein
MAPPAYVANVTTARATSTGGRIAELQDRARAIVGQHTKPLPGAAHVGSTNR